MFKCIYVLNNKYITGFLHYPRKLSIFFSLLCNPILFRKQIYIMNLLVHTNKMFIQNILGIRNNYIEKYIKIYILYDYVPIYKNIN